MAKKSDRQTAAPLPFTTFGEIAALGLQAQVYCIGCKQWSQIDAADPRWANRRFAGLNSFRSTDPDGGPVVLAVK